MYPNLGAGTRVMRVLVLLGNGPLDGWGSITVHLPGAPPFVGTSLYAQWIVHDPHAGGSLSSTQAVELRLFD